MNDVFIWITGTIEDVKDDTVRGTDNTELSRRLVSLSGVFSEDKVYLGDIKVSCMNRQPPNLDVGNRVKLRVKVVQRTSGTYYNYVLYNNEHSIEVVKPEGIQKTGLDFTPAGGLAGPIHPHYLDGVVEAATAVGLAGRQAFINVYGREPETGDDFRVVNTLTIFITKYQGIELFLRSKNTTLEEVMGRD